MVQYERETNVKEIEIRVKEMKNIFVVFCIGLLNSIPLSPKLSVMVLFSYHTKGICNEG